MIRIRAEALALVNWRGVFYERFKLDRHVTGLEGDNGAGKTTIMIAAYVVLLPDMTRLLFTNLGESGATGGDKGIRGATGRVGSPLVRRPGLPPSARRASARGRPPRAQGRTDGQTDAVHRHGLGPRRPLAGHPTADPGRTRSGAGA